MIRTHNISPILKVAIVLISTHYTTCQIADEFGLYDSAVEKLLEDYKLHEEMKWLTTN